MFNTKIITNTKLESFEKSILKKFKKEHPTVKFFSFPDRLCTIVIKKVFPGSRMAKIGISWASPDERKFRVKVGEYLASSNLITSHFYVPIDESDFAWYAESLAYCTSD